MKEKKEKIIEKLKNIFESVKLLILLDIHGISAENMRYLRSMLNKENQNIKVFKNKLSEYAIRNTPLKSLMNNFKGQIALVWDVNNSPTSAQILKEFEKNKMPLKIKYGYHNGIKVNSKYIRYLSNIPNMQELRIKILNTILRISKKILLNIKYQSLTIINILKIKKT